MGDYVTDDVRVLLDEAIDKALDAGTEWEVFERVVQEQWHTYSSARDRIATKGADPAE